jgi:RNA polymerase sigma-70 factor (ECF subfamily)
MEQLLSNLNAAYNLARWLTRNDADAEDVVQEAYLRALKHFGSFHGSDVRPWLLAIVRNTFYTWLQQNRAPERQLPFDDEIHFAEDDHLNPEQLLVQKASSNLVRHAIEELPAEFREVIVLRELEGLSYKQIADVTENPVGTVMSRLSRARKRLERSLSQSREQTEKPQVEVRQKGSAMVCGLGSSTP